MSRLESLSSAAAGGDENAFRALVEETTPIVYRLAVRFLGSEAEAQDIVQDTYVRVWRNLNKVRDHGAVLGWICRICRNLATDRIRAARRRPTDSLDRQSGVRTLIEQIVTDDPNPEEQVSAAETGQAISELVAGLKEKHRMVLLLREVDGMSNEEISVVLGCPVGTVESRLHRARLALAKKVERARKRAREMV